MAGKAKHKSGGGTHKDSATKHTMNPIGHGDQPPDEQTRQPEAQDPKRRIGQIGDAGNPPLMKK